MPNFFTNSYITLFLMPLLVGCAGIPFNSDDYTNTAKAIAYPSMCVERGYVNRDYYNQYADAVHGILVNYSYNRTELEELTTNYYNQASNTSDVVDMCKQTQKTMQTVTTAEAHNAGRAVGYNRTMQAFSDTGTSLYQQNMSYGSGSPVVVPTPSFGQEQNQTRYYRVNGPNGTKNCTVTASGYTYCN